MAQRFGLLFVSLIMVIFLQSAFTQEMTTPEVSEMVFCTGVEDRVPVGVDTMFLNTVGQVYCFTKIEGVEGTATISHVWYHGDKEMAKVDLTIMGSPWRTWSSKKIAEDWGGTWRVDVVDEAGGVLKSKEFMIQSVSE
jgi:hypothetical protein